jgi:hypothetical protein
MGEILSAHVEIHFLSLSTWEGFGQHTFEIKCVSLMAKEGFGQHMWRVIPFQPGMGGVWSTSIQIYFVSSLTWDGFVHHMLRSVLFHRLHGRGLVNRS